MQASHSSISLHPTALSRVRFESRQGREENRSTNIQKSRYIYIFYYFNLTHCFTIILHTDSDTQSMSMSVRCKPSISFIKRINLCEEPLRFAQVKRPITKTHCMPHGYMTTLQQLKRVNPQLSNNRQAREISHFSRPWSSITSFSAQTCYMFN